MVKARGLWLLAALAAGAAADVQIENASFAVVAFVREEGRFEDAQFRTLGYVRPDGRVEDMRFRALGYVRDDGRVEDASFVTAGYIRQDGRIEDARFQLVGFVRAGEVTDQKYRVVIHFTKGRVEGGMGPALAAYLFFFSHALFVQLDWPVVLTAEP